MIDSNFNDRDIINPGSEIDHRPYRAKRSVRQEKTAAFTASPPPDIQVSPVSASVQLPMDILDLDAVKILQRLSRLGHEAYFVGGCVRDLLLGITPKDFDIATSAMPQEIRRQFRNCRIIGRRFRLAHLHFNDNKIIEVATFRRTATETDDISERHAADNLFGGSGDDAIRRDFTINALMYDVTNHVIHDWVGGLDDIKQVTLRTIGCPDRRLPEDPVRIIRAIKFAVKLKLNIDPLLNDAMMRHASLIQNCARSRLVEELFKLLRSGAAAACFVRLRHFGVLSFLLPELSAHWNETGGSDTYLLALSKADELSNNGHRVSDELFLTALFYPACRETLQADGDVMDLVTERIKQLTHPMVFNRRHLMAMRQLLMTLPIIAEGPSTKKGRKMLDREWISEAITLFALVAKSARAEATLAQWRAALSGKSDSSNSVSTKTKPRKPRKRIRKRHIASPLPPTQLPESGTGTQP